MFERAEISALPESAREASPTISKGSTLIEFPAATARSPRPPWRKELSERVREVQQRRQREEEEALHAGEERSPVASESYLGLVPPSVDPSTLNPIVAAALRRIERAHRQPLPPPPPRTRPTATNGAHGAAALARVVEEKQTERFTPATATAPAAETASAPVKPPLSAPAEKPKKFAEPERFTSFVMVVPDRQNDSVHPSAHGHPGAAMPPQPTTLSPQPAAAIQSTAPIQPLQPAKPAVTPKPPAPTIKPSAAHTPPAPLASLMLPPAPQPRRVFAEAIDDEMLSRHETTQRYNTTKAASTNTDAAPLSTRFVGGSIDLLLVAFAVSPVAAIIELTNGDWTNMSVIALVCGILTGAAFLYLVASTALAGRTWGMSLVSLRTVDATTREAPTTKQCVRRALIQMLSVVPLGLGLIYALLDVESRPAHDRLSNTIVVRE